jgi:hypothetical protein
MVMNDTQSEHPLLILREDDTYQWALSEATIVIGRDESCDIVLPDRQVSREHARIELRDGAYVIADLGSTNGTFINGEPLRESAQLRDGDEVGIAARYKLFFVDRESTAPLVSERRGVDIDTDTMRVYLDGTELDPPLSPPQYELLKILVENAGAVVTRDDLIQAVWPQEDPAGISEEAVHALVRRLRMRLAEAHPGHDYVVTVRGYGFRLENKR